jgi:hypothetical protein
VQAETEAEQVAVKVETAEAGAVARVAGLRAAVKVAAAKVVVATAAMGKAAAL